MMGYYKYYSHACFLFCFLMIGAAQSICFPCLVSIVGGWFSRSSRGFITGSWGTSTNCGNIIGIQLSAIILRISSDHWEILMVLITVLFTLNAIIIITSFTPHPLLKNLIIELSDQIESFRDKKESQGQIESSVQSTEREDILISG